MRLPGLIAMDFRLTLYVAQVFRQPDRARRFEFRSLNR
jgi:hypothetical protein